MPSENEDSNELMFESPFQSNEDSMEFMVLPNTGYAPPKNLFLGLFFTIIIAVFVVPESGGAVFIGQAQVEAIAIPWYYYAFSMIKVMTKYLVLFAYAAFMISLGYKKYFKKRMKSAKKV